MKAPRRIAALGAVVLLSACGTVRQSVASLGLENPLAGVDNPFVGSLRGESAPTPAPADDWTAANFAPWSPQTPAYLLYPGDEIQIRVPSAPELSTTATIAPDGRVSFPYVGDVMAANRSAQDVSQSLSSGLAGTLRRPYVEVSPVAFGSQKVWVLGEVGQPGMYDLAGPMGALEAVALAGGFTSLADRGNVWIVRRAPDGRPMRRVVDLRATLRGSNGGDYDVLARQDVVYVTRSGLASAGMVMQQIADLVPFNFGFSYDLSGDGDSDISPIISTP